MSAGDSSVVIRTERLTRTFGQFVAVDQVSFQVQQGEIFGYLGANGAGKSTTIRMLCGLLAPSAGQGWVAGHDVGQNPEAVKRSLGYMSQKFSLYPDLLVQENLEFFGGAYGLRGRRLKERIMTVLKQVDLWSQRQVRTSQLSGGMRQRLALASSMLHQPGILFLDEPTAGVDPGNRRQFWRLIRQLSEGGTTIFVTTHYMDEAEFCHRIGLMVQGQLVALDTPEALKRQHIQGQLYRLEGPRVAQALRRCEALSGVLDAQPFGASAHVLVDPQQLEQPQLAQRLQEAVGSAGWQEMELEPIEPTLEDVFLAVVEAK